MRTSGDIDRQSVRSKASEAKREERDLTENHLRPFIRSVRPQTAADVASPRERTGRTAHLHHKSVRHDNGLTDARFLDEKNFPFHFLVSFMENALH